MAASDDNIISEFFLNFNGFLLDKGFREKCNHTELALNFIQKK